MAVHLPKTPTQNYQPNNSMSIWSLNNVEAKNNPPMLPAKPRKPSEPQRRQDTSPPPPELPPRLARTPNPNPNLPPKPRGVLEARSPHMDPVDCRRDNKFVTNHNYNSMAQNSPPSLPPRRHSNVTNGSHQGKQIFIFIVKQFDLFILFSGQRYPPPPLSLRAGSEGTSPSSYSPGLFDAPALPNRGAPPLSASARISTTSQHFDLNNSIGAMSITPSSSTSGGGTGHAHRPHFDFNNPVVSSPQPPPRPPSHRSQRAPVNSFSTFDDAM